jgi:hypothetical protein
MLGDNVLSDPALAILAALIVAGIYLTQPGFFNPLIASRNKTTAEQTKKGAVIAGEGFSRAVDAELGKVPESESARRAFNTLASFWKVPPVPEGINLDPFNQMERAALDRELRLYRFSGNLGALLRINFRQFSNLPCRIYRETLHFAGGHGAINSCPPQLKGGILSSNELEKHWSERFLLERSLDLPTIYRRGQRKVTSKEAAILKQGLQQAFDRCL